MDPCTILSVASVAARLVYKAARLSYELHKKITGAAEELKSLGSELSAFHRTLESIETLLKNNELTQLLRGWSGNDVKQSLISLQEILNRCSVSVDKLNSILQKLKGRRSSLLPGILAINIDFEKNHIAKYLNEIPRYQISAQLCYSQIQTVICARTGNSVDRVEKCVAECKDKDDQLRTQILLLRQEISKFRTPGTNADGSVDDESADIAQIHYMEGLLTSSKNIQSVASQYAESLQGSIRDDMSVIGLSAEKQLNIENWAYQMRVKEEGDEDDNEEDFEAHHIRIYKRSAEEAIQANDFARAQNLYEKFISKAEVREEWSHEDILEAKLGLSIALCSQQEYHAARGMLETLASQEWETAQHLQITCQLAKTCYLAGELKVAREHGIAAAKGRRTQFGSKSQQFHESVSLVVRILDALDETEEADVWRTYVPQSFESDPGLDFLPTLSSPSMDVVLPTVSAHRNMHRFKSDSTSSAISFGDVRFEGNNRILEGHYKEVTSIAFSGDGNFLISASLDGSALRWSLYSEDEPTRYNGDFGKILAVAISSNGQKLAFGCDDNRIRLLWASSKQVIRTLEGHSAPITSVSFSPDGSILVSGSLDKKIKLWHTGTGRLVRTLRGHKDNVRSVAYSPLGVSVTSGSWDQSVRIWDAQSGKEIGNMKDHTGKITCVAYSPQGTLVASAAWDRTLRLWTAGDGSPVMTIHTDEVLYCVTFSPGGQSIIGGSATKLFFWEVSSGRLLNTFVAGELGPVKCLVHSPIGRCLAFTSDDHRVCVLQ